MPAHIPITHSLTALTGEFAVCALARDAEIPAWVPREGFWSVTRTTEELSIICAARAVPDGIRCETGWRCLKLEGPFELDAVGILLSVIQPLAAESISVLAIGAYETDYVLIKQHNWEMSIAVLRSYGHSVNELEKDW